MKWNTAFDLTKAIAQRVSITGRLFEHYNDKAHVDGYHSEVLVMVNYKGDSSLDRIVYRTKLIRIEMESHLLSDRKVPTSLSLKFYGHDCEIGYKPTFYFDREFLPGEIKSFFDKNNIQTRKEVILLVEHVAKTGIIAEMPDTMPDFLSYMLNLIYNGQYPSYN